MSELLAHGRSIPDHIRIIGFDDIGVSALARPRLTTDRQPVEAMTTRVVSLASAPGDTPPRHEHSSTQHS